MATRYECSLCQRELKTHCQSKTCRWFWCTNRFCEAKYYDLDRGTLLRHNGRVEQLGSPG
jgi:hypothetical protein